MCPGDLLDIYQRGLSFIRYDCLIHRMIRFAQVVR